MKSIFFSILAAIVCGGCVTMNPCPYCREKRSPDYEYTTYDKLDDDGLVKRSTTKIWVRVLRERKIKYYEDIK